MSLFGNVWKLAVTKPKQQSLFFSAVSEISYHLDYQEKLQGHPDTTTLHYTTLHPPPLHYVVQCSVQGYTLVQCSVVQWCRGDLEMFPSNLSDKVSQKQVKKQVFFWCGHSRFPNFSKKGHKSGQIPILGKLTHMCCTFRYKLSVCGFHFWQTTCVKKKW